MNDTNLLAALATLALSYTNTFRATNWVNTGNSHFRDGTNYVEQWCGEITQTEVRESVVPTIVYVTNTAVIKYSRELFSKTNAVLRVTPSGKYPLPPTPGVPTKL